MKTRRRYLTLMETLLVIFLLSLILGLIGINVNKAVHEQRFRSEVGMVVDTLRIAQNIMLILDNDVHVKFTQGDKGIRMHIETACPLSENWGKLILTPKYLRTIHILNFKDRLLGENPQPGIVDIRFLSSGYVMSQGILRMATAEAVGTKTGLESFLCLPGYPAALASVSIRPEEPRCYSLLEEGFVESMTNQMVNEIKSLEAAKKPAKDENEKEAPTEPGKKNNKRQQQD